MHILVIGCNGQLGHDTVSLCRAGDHSVRGIDYPEIDISDKEHTRRIVAESGADTVINCAAYTAVDDCERNSETAFRINAGGIANIAHGARDCGAATVHISTDYVFDGTKNSPYTESDAPNPLSVYGKSKLEGERLLAGIVENFYIFRIAWLYGAQGNNFVKTIRSLAQRNGAQGLPLKVVNDQFGTPTWTKDVVRQILLTLGKGTFGIFHCTGEGACTWYDFACAIVKSFGIRVEVVPCSTAEFPRLAVRPRYGVLENAMLKKIGINAMPQWLDSYASFRAEFPETGI
jgi:dTDP-4-dehydrorhamnose reductase